LRSRILIGLIAGAIGGALGWLLQEHFINYDSHIVAGIITGQAAIKEALSPRENRVLVLCVGGLIGLFLGSVDGIVEGNQRKLLNGILIGAFAGFLLGFIGLNLGGIIFNLLGGSSSGVTGAGFGAFARQVIARAFGWALMGLGMGTGSALSSRSPQRIRNGAIGGFLGGFIGGLVFDLMAQGANPVQGALGNSGPHDVGGPSRAVGFTAIGALTGFFIGLVDELTKQGWVKVLAGRNEGKEYLLSKAVSVLGRDERADVPLYGDGSVMPQHAAIRSDGHRHTLIDAGTQTGTLVNGQRLDPANALLLRDGDMIQIGTQRILFREKATANKFNPASSDAPRSKSSGPLNAPMPAHLCPYCGAPKDASGNCLCTLGGSAAPASGYNPNAGMNPAFNQPLPPPLGGYDSPTSYGGVGTMVGAMVGMAAGRLVGLEGSTLGQVFTLSAPNMVIGREPGKDIVLANDTTVSRTHARIANENGQFVVYDNGSANGTYVNGVRITAQPITPGDIVQFGASKFRFE
jgi:pSer/pThr/pTyr-binding forkhead associated (FHA) protein